MGEHIVVRQDRNFITDILAADPHRPEADHLEEVHHIHELTPYGMMMASLAACTGIVMHTYAQYHDIDLREVSFDLHYDRVFAEDCADCEGTEPYHERIEEAITVRGDLTERDRDRLYAVSRHCPIHKILVNGMEVNSYLERG